jgi:hypothetical protein
LKDGDRLTALKVPDGGIDGERRAAREKICCALLRFAFTFKDYPVKYGLSEVRKDVIQEEVP